MPDLREYLENRANLLRREIQETRERAFSGRTGVWNQLSKTREMISESRELMKRVEDVLQGRRRRSS